MMGSKPVLLKVLVVVGLSSCLLRLGHATCIFLKCLDEKRPYCSAFNNLYNTQYIQGCSIEIGEALARGVDSGAER